MPLNDEFWEEEEAALWAAIVALYIQTVMQGVDGGINALPAGVAPLVNFDDINSASLAQSAEFKRNILDSIHGTTREQVERAIEEWQETGGGDLNVLDAMLDPIFSEARGDMIGITETTRAFKDGNTAAWAAAGGYVLFHQWNTQRDERVCLICGPKDGNVYPITGEAPPAHPRCRCWVSPILRLPNV